MDAEEDSISSSGTAAVLDRPPIAVTLPMPVTVKERYLEIRQVSDDTVITVVELLSPANKRRGKGRNQYEEKRFKVLGSASHFVEIDLLRGEPRLPINNLQSPSDYYILVSRANLRPQAQLYPFSIRETFPTFLVPLKRLEESISVDMQSIFEGVVNRASYDLRINYTRSVPPPVLSSEDENWVEDLLKNYENSLADGKQG